MGETFHDSASLGGRRDEKSQNKSGNSIRRRRNPRLRYRITINLSHKKESGRDRPCKEVLGKNVGGGKFFQGKSRKKRGMSTTAKKAGTWNGGNEKRGKKSVFHIPEKGGKKNGEAFEGPYGGELASVHRAGASERPETSYRGYEVAVGWTSTTPDERSARRKQTPDEHRGK